MADKELRKLNRRELLKMLLVQCEETERLTQESDEIREQFNAMAESYGRLKKKLDLKDARLNQKDAKIAELRQEIEDMKKSRAIELEDAGSIAEAAIRINGVFEAAQKAAEQYLMNVRELSERERENKQIPFEPGRISGTRRKTKPARSRQTVPMSLSQTADGRSKKYTEESPAGELKLAAAAGDIHGQ